MEKQFFPGSAGRNICGILNDAGGNKTLPLAVLVHGLGSSKDSTTNQMLEKIHVGVGDLGAHNLDAADLMLIPDYVADLAGGKLLLEFSELLLQRAQPVGHFARALLQPLDRHLESRRDPLELA